MKKRTWQGGEKLTAGTSLEEHTLEAAVAECAQSDALSPELDMAMQEYQAEARKIEDLFNRQGDLKYQVKLSNVGNPDFRQDGRRPLPDTICGWVRVNTLGEAAEACRKYISFFDLGGGNWTGGDITRMADGLLVGYVSYNGRIWKARANAKSGWGSGVEIITCDNCWEENIAPNECNWCPACIASVAALQRP